MDNKDDNKKGCIMAVLIILTILLLIPLLLTFAVYKIMLFLFPSVLFTASNIIMLYITVASLMFGTIVMVAVISKK